MTIARGSRCPGHVLTEQDIPEILRLAAHGMSQYELAKYFGYNQSTISRVLSGRTWKHVGGTDGQC